MQRLKTLESLYSKHCNYISDKWSIYLSEYERLFVTLQQTPVTLLEIGVQNGGSLEIWDNYFPNAVKILGCDINPDCERLNYASDRINLVVGDINRSQTLERIYSIAPSFDIVIDDGSHTSSDIIHAFCHLFPRLKQGGLFIAEDLHCSYWENYQGGLYHPRSSMAFFKALADVLNFEHWGLEQQTRERLLKPFGITPELTEALLAEVHSVEFVNSMCIVTRRPAEQNRLGRRHVVGLQELVCSVKQVDGTFSEAPPQKLGGTAAAPIFQSLLELTGMLQARLESKDRQLAEQAERIGELELAHGQFHEHLSRAEAQLDLLKELLLGDGDVEPL